MQVKKLGYILFVGAIATICILPVAVMPWQTEKTVGNEQLASFPELRKEDGSCNTSILNEFSDYFADHFGFRHEMITLNDQLTGTMLKTLDSSSVLLGKDDWLFYKSTLADYTGAELFTARQSYAAARVLRLMQEYCEQNDFAFCFTIAPNKNSLYGNQMPTHYVAASVRNAQLLKQQMEQQNVRYVDLFKTLSDSKEQLYYRQDSHWNMRGAQLAAQTLLKELKGAEVEFDSRINGKTSLHTGDLYEMCTLPEARGNRILHTTLPTSMTKNSTRQMISRSTRKIQRQTEVFLFTVIPLASICILSWRRVTATPVSPGICPTV